MVNTDLPSSVPALNLKRRLSRGFTLIEMTVVVGIIALISGLVFANNTRFGGEVQLQNLAYDIALSVRQAQVFGISVQQFKGSFGAAYGMHFTANQSGSPAIYALFADVDDNGTYTNSSELVQSTTVASGYAIQDLCVTPPGGSTALCGSTLDITFKRPEPDAYIRGSGYPTGLAESARIVVASPKGDTTNIVIDANGQISVCPHLTSSGQCK